MNVRRIVGLSGVLVLLFGVGAYELWLRMALRNYPWQVESYVDGLASDCRTGPGAFVFSRELHTLTTQVDEAKLCLIRAGERWVVNRDYTACVRKLLEASSTALRLRTIETTRLQEQQTRLRITLHILDVELAGHSQTRSSGARIDIRNPSQSRTRTLCQAARNLAALGQTESALTTALQAQAAWTQSENFVAAQLARFGEDQRLALWENQAQALLRWTRESGRPAILVDKLEHRCLLLATGRVEKSYPANLGRNWYHVKVQERDASTPEGEYRIKRKFRSSNFGWALLLDYPNAADRRRFNSMKKTGEIEMRARIGGNIEIHGGGRVASDWTDGCISLEDSDMADLYREAYTGMPVTIVGTSRLVNLSR